MGKPINNGNTDDQFFNSSFVLNLLRPKGPSLTAAERSRMAIRVAFAAVDKARAEAN